MSYHVFILTFGSEIAHNFNFLICFLDVCLQTNKPLAAAACEVVCFQTRLERQRLLPDGRGAASSGGITSRCVTGSQGES